MNDKIGMFEEEKGQTSYIRVGSFISLMQGSALAWFCLITRQLDANCLALITMFIVAAFAPKAIQKFAEKNGYKE